MVYGTFGTLDDFRFAKDLLRDLNWTSPSRKSEVIITQKHEPLAQPTTQTQPYYNPRLAELDRLLIANRCNQPAVLEKLRLPMMHMTSESAALFGEQFLNGCDRDAQIGFITMESWYRVSNFGRALAILDRYPEEGGYFSDLATWKGFVLEKLGRHGEAAIAFERALQSGWDK